uniref:Uncharacterized protein n=1 Tax=Kalanchoe fedtschenkoi TaxID=63787 RepID=A0A7N0R831_KALFE
MEAMLKKFQQKYNKVKDNMSQWEDLQTRFVSHFRNASSIIHRFPVLQDSNNFGCLKSYHALPDKLLRKQMDSLQTIIMSMKLTLDEFSNVVGSLDKIVRDSRQLIKGASHQQLHQTIGVKPSLTYCIEGLQTLHDMHQSEYRLKSSLFTAFCHLTFKPK